MQKTALAMKQVLEISNEKNLLTNLLPGAQTLSEGLRITYANWSRLSHYTADRFGYLVNRKISVCVRTILALVLNNVKLAEKINVKEYLRQMSDIYLLDDLVSRFSENDETIPYGPLRIKNLLAFASTEEVIHATNITSATPSSSRNDINGTANRVSAKVGAFCCRKKFFRACDGCCTGNILP